MKRNRRNQPKYRLIKVSCISAGLLSISNPTEITAADLGIIELSTGDLQFTPVANPFPQSPLGVHVATGDLDDDGVAEIIIAPPSGQLRLAINEKKHCCNPRIFDIPVGANLAPNGGVVVATGDLDGNGAAEIMASSATGASSSGSFFKFDGIKAELTTISSFDNIFPDFSGGVRVASGDLDGDSSPDFVAGKVSKIDALTIKQTVRTHDSWIDLDPPLPPGVGGVEVAMGDVDGDGLDEVFVVPREATPGTALTPYLRSSKQKSWLAIDSWSEPAGVHVAMGDINGDSLADLIVGSPVGVDAYIQGYGLEVNASSIGLPKITPKIAKESHGKFRMAQQGVRVAVGDVTGDGNADIVFAPASVPEPAVTSIFAVVGGWLLGGRRRKRDGSPSG